MVVANHLDEADDDCRGRQVTTEEGAELARLWGAPFFEVSAKTRINVDESFHQLIRQINIRPGAFASLCSTALM